MWNLELISTKNELTKQAGPGPATGCQLLEHALQQGGRGESLWGYTLLKKEGSWNDLRGDSGNALGDPRFWLRWQAHKHKKRVPINTS